MQTTNRLLAAIAAFLLSTGSAQAAPPPIFTYSGFLQDGSGNPVGGVHNFTFSFWPAASGGIQVGTDVTENSVSVGADGYFSVVLDVTSFAAAFTAQTYMAVKLDAEAPMSPRIPLTSVPGALSVPFSGIAGWPTAPCPGGQFATGYDVNGNLFCAAPAVTGVTNVAVGTGLTGGGTGAVAIAANLTTAGGDNGAATTVARGDHAHGTLYPTIASLQAAGTVNDAANPVDFTKLKNVPLGFADGNDAGVTAITPSFPLTATVSGSGATIGLQSCPAATPILKFVGSAWSCVADDAGVTSLGATAAGGLVITGSVTAPSIGLRADCGPDQVLKWSGTSWDCQDDNDTSTVYTGVSPISVSGSSISMQPASSLQPGYLTSIDWMAFNTKVSTFDAPFGGGLMNFGTGTDVTLSLEPCGSGEILKYLGGKWQCAQDDSPTYLGQWPIVAGGNTISLSSSGCAAGQALKADGVGFFRCQDDAGVTSVSAAPGTPIGVSPGSAPVLSMSPASTTSSGYLSAPDYQRFDSKQATLDASCGVGYYIRAIDPNGFVTCGTDLGGTITGVSAGNGLTGGGTTGNVTLGVIFSGTGTLKETARSDHNHDTAYAPKSPMIGGGVLTVTTGPIGTGFFYPASGATVTFPTATTCVMSWMLELTASSASTGTVNPWANATVRRGATTQAAGGGDFVLGLGWVASETRSGGGSVPVVVAANEATTFGCFVGVPGPTFGTLECTVRYMCF